MSLDRAQEPSGLETEMWESLACRNWGAWEKGDSQGTTKVECFAYSTHVLLLDSVLKMGIVAPK